MLFPLSILQTRTEYERYMKLRSKRLKLRHNSNTTNKATTKIRVLKTITDTAPKRTEERKGSQPHTNTTFNMA